MNQCLIQVGSWISGDGIGAVKPITEVGPVESGWTNISVETCTNPDTKHKNPSRLYWEEI